MPIVLFRVDERLIHGQVVVGWGGVLDIDRVIVVDDEIFANPWEQELYCLGLPGGIEAQFFSVEDARDAFSEWAEDAARTVLLVRDVATLRALADHGVLQAQEVNLGGIHHAPGRERVLPYLFLSPAEKMALEQLAAQGVPISAQDLPGARRVPLKDLLGSA